MADADKKEKTETETETVVLSKPTYDYFVLSPPHVHFNFSMLCHNSFVKVDSLDPMSVGFNVIVRVGKITSSINRLHLDGSRLRISEALIGDETGSILLSLRNDQIGMVEEGKCYILRNAKVYPFILTLHSCHSLMHCID